MSDLFSGFANFTKQVQSTLNSYEVRKFGDKVQGYVLNFTEVELKVREATNEDPWGPTGPQQQEIAQLTFQYDAFPEIMSMLWKRMLQDNRVAWRRVYKSLILLNGLLKSGSERVISNARDRLFELRALESYSCIDERGRDQGVNIRHRVKQIIELLQDEELLMEERRKTKTENKEKYQGFSKEDMMMRGGSSKMSSFDSWNDKKFNSRKYDDFELPEPRGREVNSFDFDNSRNRSSSPELGIPDHGQYRKQDDDEFGEFADARTSPSERPSNAKSQTTAAEPDLFGGFASSNSTDFSNSRLPKPPSCPSSPVGALNLSIKTPPASNLEATLFDLDSAPISSSTSNSVQNNNHEFDFFGSSTQPLSNSNAANEIDLFGNFNSNSTAPINSTNTTSATNNSTDLDNIFGSLNSTPGVPQNNFPNNMSGWGQLSTPTPLPVSTTNPNAAKTEQKPKVGDEWSFMEKQLDGLVLGNKQKPPPSMNELRTRQI
ncbi:ENTH domain-containing protein [Aphelenchoides besseyi]|nr:ENTH domain-containing protein [Aphelenchoides besseyi]KAI6200863.1 ENTH domain-containing protein [Aphelenchoides besseyi]